MYYKACRAGLISEEKNVTFPKVPTLFLKWTKMTEYLDFY